MPKIQKASLVTRKVPGTGVISRIAPIGFDKNRGIKCLFYGSSGSGKTTLWATFPGKILVLICSGGKDPGELMSVDTPAYRAKIDQVVINESAEIREVVNHVRDNPEYNTIVLDHVTGLQDLTLKEILGLDEIPVQKSFGMAHQQQYGQSTQMCKEFIRAMLGLTINVVIIGQERIFTPHGDEEAAAAATDVIRPFVSVAATPSLAGWLVPACDYVIQTYKRPKMGFVEQLIGGKKQMMETRLKGVEYCARCEAHDVFATKFRAPMGLYLPDAIVDPTYDKIMSVIRGTYKKPGQPTAAKTGLTSK